MGNYNSQQLFRRYPNKLGKYAIHIGAETSEVKYHIIGRSGNSLCNNKKPGQKQAKRLGDNLYDK